MKGSGLECLLPRPSCWGVTEKDGKGRGWRSEAEPEVRLAPAGLGAISPQGMVMVSPEMNPTICSVFEAEIVLLFHATTFRRGFQVTVHVGNVRQTAVVEKIHAKVSGPPLVGSHP